MALTDTFVKLVKTTDSPAGDKYADGGGMYLLVKSSGKYWRMDYRFAEKRKTLAIGVYPAVSLAKARKRRESARELLADGVDPSDAKREQKEAVLAESVNTFKAVALEWHRMKSKGCAQNTAKKLLTQLEKHIFPEIGARPIAEIKPPDILKMLRKVEAAGTAYTAGRLREISGQVFRYGIQTGRCEIDPAAAMRGAIASVQVKHRPALTTRREFGEFVRDLRDTTRADPLTKLCAQFGLLTWTRPKELRQAKWKQIDIEAAEWRIPAAEMKTGKHLQAHTVPLSKQAISILASLRDLSGHTEFLFPSNGAADRVISENTINNLFRRIGYKDKQSHHGLRASARSLLSEREWQAEALERQLDHREANKVVAAYARSQHLDERRKFMADWGALVEGMGAGGNVVPLKVA